MTLSDGDIVDQMNNGGLVKNGDIKQAKGSSYELRMGTTYYDLTESDRPIQVKPGEDILIKPGHRVVLITHEEIDVPHDMVVRVVSKGSLFSIGLSPVATYADPGFSGNLGIVTQNISDKYVVLPIMEPIAKADFSKLTMPSVRPYDGQHGFKTQIWPIKHQLQKSYNEVADDPRVGTEKDEGYMLLPQTTAAVLRDLERRQFIIGLAILLALLLNALVVWLVGSQLINNLAGLIGSLIASLLVTGALALAKWRT